MVVEVDLATGRERTLVEHQRYWEAGHFNSFDAIFYRKSEIKDYLCKDLEAKTDFLLYERIKEKIKAAFQWGVTSITNTIIVFTREDKNNVVLYNIRKKEVVDYNTIDFHPSERGSLRSYLDKSTGQLIVHCSDFNLDSGNRIINSTCKYYKIRF